MRAGRAKSAVQFAYSPGSGFPGAITRISGPASTVADYPYSYVIDPAGMAQRFQVTTVTYADGRGRRFTHDGQLRFVTASDLLGVVTDHHEYQAMPAAIRRPTGLNRNTVWEVIRSDGPLPP